MSGAVLNSRFLTRLLTSGEEDFERVSVLNEELVNCMAMLILSISVTFSVNCLTAACLITKSCQQRWPIHSCSFYKVTVVQQQIWGLVVYFRVHLVGFNFCLQVKKNIKIGQYLPKLCSNEKWSSFLRLTVLIQQRIEEALDNIERLTVLIQQRIEEANIEAGVKVNGLLVKAVRFADDQAMVSSSDAVRTTKDSRRTKKHQTTM